MSVDPEESYIVGTDAVVVTGAQIGVISAIVPSRIMDGERQIISSGGAQGGELLASVSIWTKNKPKIHNYI